jgi:hypothetical protein
LRNGVHSAFTPPDVIDWDTIMAFRAG